MLEILLIPEPNWNWSKTKIFPAQNTSSAEKWHPLAGSVQQEGSLPLRVLWKPPTTCVCPPPPLCHSSHQQMVTNFLSQNKLPSGTNC